MRTIVVAYGMEDHAIGTEGKLLWQGELPADMDHFAEVTKNSAVIMGRKTYYSIPEKYRPLEHRQNIVLSMSETAIHRNVHVVQSLEQAYKTARYEPMIIGGGEIYQLALPTVNKVIATEVLKRTPNADTTFPRLSMDEWDIVEEEEHQPDDRNKYGYSFITYLRRNPIEE